MSKILEFAFSYAKLKPKEREVIEFLYKQKNQVFLGGYSNLVREMGLPTYENVSNYRKTILALENKGIVAVTKGNVAGNGVIVAVSLTSNWQEIVLKGGVV